uniref:Reverse transcriptase domain-containing protein n=1 Tax=Oryza brachyantha TaxID=4533 RepID=J3KVR0_ORYBR
MNATNIVLIPKKNNPTHPTDFRPISLCNVSFKILAKSLANQIKDHLPSIINPNQQAFIKGRKPSTNLILAQEIIHSFTLKSFTTDAFLLKLDLPKAFDRLEWNFISLALHSKGFDNHFIQLVRACIQSASFSVTINGTTGHFMAQRGIRQGCPLSPYLFVLALNVLADNLQEQANLGNIKGVTLGTNGPPIHSLFYDDDLIITGQANSQEASVIHSTLQNFFNLSGQTPNRGKSSIVFASCTSPASIALVKQLFPVSDFSSSTTYLGHPLLISTSSKNSAYFFLLDKFKSKLSSLRANKISHAGRLALMKSIFASIPIYHVSHILLSKKLIRKLRPCLVSKFFFQKYHIDFLDI